MNKRLILISTLVFVFAFSFVLTFDASAKSEECKYDPQYCCTYETWCGTEGWGSWVMTTCIDPLGREYRCRECRYLVPGQPYYNPCCDYRAAAGCPSN